MMNRLEPGYILPNQKIPKLVGLFNIGFGTLLLLTGIAYVAVAILFADASTSTSWGSGPPKPMISASANTIQVGISPGKPGANSAGPAYFWAEVSIGMLINLLMIVSGVGLLRLRNWARELALWVAALKVARLFVMTVVAIIIALPGNDPNSAANSTVMIANGGGGNAFTVSAAQFELLAITIAAAGGFVFGVLYPALAFILLKRKTVWAACVDPRPPLQTSIPAVSNN